MMFIYTLLALELKSSSEINVVTIQFCFFVTSLSGLPAWTGSTNIFASEMDLIREESSSVTETNGANNEDSRSEVWGLTFLFRGGAKIIIIIIVFILNNFSKMQQK